MTAGVIFVDPRERGEIGRERYVRTRLLHSANTYSRRFVSDLGPGLWNT
jgi:hypothetical protein